MSFWMREASLQIGSKKYSMDNLYFEFEVPFEDSDTRRPNSKPTTCLRAPERVSSAGTLSSSTQATRATWGLSSSAK